MGVYENIKEIADKRGISIARLEEKAGVGNGVIGKWRKKSPTVANLKKVADVLGVTANRLLR